MYKVSFSLLGVDGVGVGVTGVEEDFLVYTYTVLPFASFFVSLKVYSGISFLSVLPFSGVLISLPFSSTNVVTTLW